MDVFLDSSFIIALILDKDDLNHKAISIKEKGIFNNDCYISNLIINEVITIIGNKTDKTTAKYAYYFLKDNCILINENEISHINDKIMETYVKYDTKLSFTDSSIIAVMKEHEITHLVSFNNYFNKVKEITLIH